MKRASKLFSEFERTRIEQAVTEAEANTDAEIVPAVATSSGGYDRAEDVFGLWVGLFAMGVTWFILRRIEGNESQWGAPWTRYELPLLIAAVVAGFILGAVLATYIPWLRRAFTPRKEMRNSVNRAAAQVFFDGRIHHTKCATGLLIYLSLYERTATIRADQKALDSLGQEAIDEICANLIEGIQSGDPATALCDVIGEVGRRLAEILPKTGENPNELGNALILID